MLLRSIREVSWNEKEGDESRGFRVRSLFNQEQGARKLALRLYELSPGGQLPYHAYVWEQELFILEGEGTVRSPDEELPLSPGDAVLIRAGEPHQFTAGAGGLRILCSTPILTTDTKEDADRSSQADANGCQEYATHHEPSEPPSLP